MEFESVHAESVARGGLSTSREVKQNGSKLSTEVQVVVHMPFEALHVDDVATGPQFVDLHFELHNMPAWTCAQCMHCSMLAIGCEVACGEGRHRCSSAIHLHTQPHKLNIMFFRV